jgi:hypothetical protein
MAERRPLPGPAHGAAPIATLCGCDRGTSAVQERGRSRMPALEGANTALLR